MSDNLIVMNIVCISIMMIAVFITGIRVICCLEGRERKENKSVLLTDHVIISTNVQAIRLGLMLEGWEKILIATMFILCVFRHIFWDMACSICWNNFCFYFYRNKHISHFNSIRYWKSVFSKS